jgi:hypothetical protein
MLREAERGYDGSYVYDIKGRPSRDPDLKTSDGTGPKMKTLQWEPRRLEGDAEDA